MPTPVLRAAAVAFVASFCTLVIEISAGRVLAPFVGVSLYTWTSIIGVVLAGISLGAWAGGWLADRRPVPSTLGWLLLAAGAASIVIAPATPFLAGDDGLLTVWGIATTLLQRVVVLSILLFFLPSFFLGMISPVAVKLAVRDLQTTGSIVGRIYAVSTLGSIAGTFVTGFYLVARFGTRTTLIGVGAVLIVTALALGDLFGRKARAVVVAVIVGFSLYAGLWPGSPPPPYQDPLIQPAGSGTIHRQESQYFTIEVERTIREDTGAPLHALHLDHLVHSYSDPEDPAWLEYGYLRLFSDVADWRAQRAEPSRMLFVGGGGYTLPRLIDHRYPDVEIDVVEIDPAVTRVARRFFGIGRDSGIRTINEDARWYVLRAAETYDAIFIDAFNDLSVPYHLTTLEATRDMRRLLTRDGALVANVVDDYHDGTFLASYVRTLQTLFGERNVAIVLEGEEDVESDRSTFVVIASSGVQSILASLRADSHVVHGPEVTRYVRSRGAIVLTDDFAPVDNMLAPLFAKRFVDE